jgi:hypothetical protein
MKMNTVTINIASQFSRYPAGRYKADGPYSGEAFRDDFLIPQLRQPDTRVVIQLDGARGLASSFLEEAFGGLVRAGFDSRQLHDRLVLESKDASLINEIEEYIGEQSESHP